MTKVRKNIFDIITISIFVFIGLFFRLEGISVNQSFWADEAYVSSFSRDIVSGNVSFATGINTLGYQRLQTIVTAVFFKLFGASEWSARLPSVIWGCVGIVFSYLIARKYSNRWGGFLAAFLYTFLQINLAHSTQAKPYAAIETLFLMSVYFIDSNIFLSTIIAVVSSLYNFVGVIAFIPIIINLISRYGEIKKKPFFVVVGFVCFALFGWWLNIGDMFYTLIHPSYNWISLLRDLFWRQFGLITLPAIFGLFLIKDKKVFLSIFLTLFGLLVAWNFVMYSHNLRYLLPVFGIIVVLFGIFWGQVGDVVFDRPAHVSLLIMALIFAGGYKIVRKPAVYYTPNADFFADVQNADYKTFFQLTYEKFPDIDKYPIFSNLVDSFAWYAHKKPTTLFKVGNLPPYLETQSGTMVYPDITYFLSEVKKYPKGFVVVEDWQSILPEDIKEFVKKNMRLELRVESMSVSPEEKWPLELYSWDFENKK